MKTQRKKRYLGTVLVFGAALMTSGLVGCMWDSETHDTFVNIDGTVAPECKGLKQVRMRDDTICIAEVCPGKDCEADCMNIKGLKKVFANERCPANYQCDAAKKECYMDAAPLKCKENECKQFIVGQGDVCLNTADRCGNHCLDCNKRGGAEKGRCEGGACIIEECALGFHMLKDDTGTVSCSLNNFNKCGNPREVKVIRDCEKELNASRGDCTNKGECIVSSCKTGFHLNDGKCDPNTTKACGSPHNNCEVRGWAGGECKSDGLTVSCVATSCDPEFCLQKPENVCIDGRRNANACGAGPANPECRPCSEIESCLSGGCVVTHCAGCTDEDTGACLIDENTQCGRSCSNCTFADGIGTGKGTCVDGSCVIVCNEGYHRTTIAGTTTCEPNTRYACGAPLHDCTQTLGWGSGDCNATLGKCNATSCVGNFHHLVVEEVGQCNEDTVRSCGFHDRDCTTREGWAQWSTGDCIGKQCVLQSCKPGSCITGTGDGRACVPGTNNADTCGIDGQDCSRCPSGQDCFDGKCVPVECSDTRPCHEPHGRTMWCDKGICKHKDCATGYTGDDCRVTCNSRLCPAFEFCGGSNDACQCVANASGNTGCKTDQKCCMNKTTGIHRCESSSQTSTDALLCP